VRETEDVAGTAMVKAAMVLKRLAIISTMPTLICGRLKDGESHADWRRIRASSCSRKSRPFQKIVWWAKEGWTIQVQTRRARWINWKTLLGDEKPVGGRETESSCVWMMASGSMRRRSTREKPLWLSVAETGSMERRPWMRWLNNLSVQKRWMALPRRLSAITPLEFCCWVEKTALYLVAEKCPAPVLNVAMKSGSRGAQRRGGLGENQVGGSGS